MEKATMGDTQNLSGAKALEKIKELAEDKTTMFCTFEDEQMVTRPMHTQGIDEDGTFWFFSEKDSPKNHMIEGDPTVHLIYANNSNYEYLSIEGRASIEHDQQKIDELWKDFAKAWFTEGKTDPSLTLIRVVPENGHYWDTKSNKVISLMKIAVGALTGKTMDNGLEGELRI
jgi:general stress protein 26